MALAPTVARRQAEALRFHATTVSEPGASPAMAFITAPRMRGGASTGSSARARGISRRSQALTMPANSASLAISDSASCCSAGGSVPRANSAASSSMSSGLAIEAILQHCKAPPQQRLDCGGRALELGRKLVPRPALVISQKHHVLAILGKQRQTLFKPAEVHGQFSLRHD